MKKLVSITILCSALIFSTTGIGAAAPVNSGNDKADLKIYGQVNRALLYVNDGYDSDTFSADNSHSSTRLGFDARAKKNDLTAGAKIEVQIQSDASTALSMKEGKTQGGGVTFAERHLNVYLQHSRLGKITLGQGSTASDGTSEVDLSGTAVVGNSDVANYAKNFKFYNNKAKDYSGVTVGDVFNNMDGLSRKDMVRYDSPTFSGVSFAASVSSYDGDDADDFAVRYRGKAGDIRLSAALSYVNHQVSSSKQDQYSGSFSVLLPFGLNLTGAYGSTQFEAIGRNNASMLYGKIGYLVDIFDAGSTAFAVDYGTHDEIKQNDDKAKVWGCQIVQKLSDWSAEVYLGVRNFTLDRSEHDMDSIVAAMTGARIKF